jgi:hypothetical protein
MKNELEEKIITIEQPVLFRQVYKHGIFRKHIQSIATISNGHVILQNFDDNDNMVLDLRIPLLLLFY